MSNERKSTISRCFYNRCSASIYKKTLMCYRHWIDYIQDLLKSDYISKEEAEVWIKDGRE